MKKTALLTFLMFFYGFFCFSDDRVHILSESRETGMQSVSVKRMSARLNQAAVEYEKYGKIARTGVYDFAFGSSLEEHKKMNSCGVIMISAQTHESGELPLKEVYFKTGQKKYRLMFLFSKPVKTMGDAAERVFGKNRADCYYLLPYAFSRMTGQVCVNWRKNRKGFVVAEFPANITLDFITAKKDKLPEKTRNINVLALKNFLGREFSFSAAEQAKAANNFKK